MAYHYLQGSVEYIPHHQIQIQIHLDKYISTSQWKKKIGTQRWSKEVKSAEIITRFSLGRVSVREMQTEGQGTKMLQSVQDQNIQERKIVQS